ncbi:hypothetical protein [Desulfosporosinus sp. SB140]|uniref:hypothetical protein n=1 Tax=Desulfosporosinus paludis TaxID=3115649 RepID=UPI00388EB36B
MSKWLSQLEKQTITPKAFGHLGIKLKYNELLMREKAGEIWLDDPVRTNEELIKGSALFNDILRQLNRIIDQIGRKNCTEEERMNGFNIIPLLGKEVSLDELPSQWK